MRPASRRQTYAPMVPSAAASACRLSNFRRRLRGEIGVDFFRRRRNRRWPRAFWTLLAKKSIIPKAFSVQSLELVRIRHYNNLRRKFLKFGLFLSINKIYWMFPTVSLPPPWIFSLRQQKQSSFSRKPSQNFLPNAEFLAIHRRRRRRRGCLTFSGGSSVEKQPEAWRGGAQAYKGVENFWME